MKKEFGDETMQSASSNGSANTASSVTNKSKVVADTAQPNGELFLLFRYLRNRKIFHGVNAKNGATRKKSVLIPQEFSGKCCFIDILNKKPNVFFVRRGKRWEGETDSHTNIRNKLPYTKMRKQCNTSFA